MTVSEISATSYFQCRKVNGCPSIFCNIGPLRLGDVSWHCISLCCHSSSWSTLSSSWQVYFWIYMYQDHWRHQFLKTNKRFWLTLSVLQEIPAQWDVVSRELVSWNNISVMEINVITLKQEKEFLEFLKNKTPKLITITVGAHHHANCLDPLSQHLYNKHSVLTADHTYLFYALYSEGVLALCQSLPQGLHNLGVGWREVREVTDHLMDKLCNQCLQVKHLHIGHIIIRKYWEDNEGARSQAVSVCRKLISHRESHHACSHKQLALYDGIKLKCEFESELFPSNLKKEIFNPVTDLEFNIL